MKHEAHYCVRNGQDEGFADLAHTDPPDGD